MTDQTVGVVNQTGTGTLKVDTSELTVGANTVERQRMVIADPVGAGLLANVTAGGALKVDASATTQPVSGTVTAGQGGAPWADNITQFGGTNLSTGTGVGGAGIPRVTVSSDSSLTANLGTLNGAATSANQVAPLAQGSATSGQTGALILGAVTTSLPSYTTAQTSPLSLTTSGLLRVDAGGTSVNAAPIAKTTGGTLLSRLHATTAATLSVKGAAGSLYGYDLYNTNAALRYVHFYNKTTAPTIGTDTPVFTLAIPPTSGVRVLGAIGGAFATGIAYGVTSDNAAIPATVGAAGDVVGTILYF